MTLFVLFFIVFTVAIAGLSIGVLLGQKALRASCGGDTAISVCGVCRKTRAR